MGRCKLNSLVSRQGRFAARRYLGVTFFLCLYFNSVSLIAFLAAFLRKMKGSVRVWPRLSGRSWLGASAGSCVCLLLLSSRQLKENKCLFERCAFQPPGVSERRCVLLLSISPRCKPLFFWGGGTRHALVTLKMLPF